MDDVNQLTAATLAALATGGGAIIWGYVLNGAIQVLKGVPQFAGAFDGREKLAAFILSGLLLAGAYWTALRLVPPTTTADVFGIIMALLSWLGLARLTMAAYDDTTKVKRAKTVKAGTRKPESLFSSAGWTGK